MQLTQEEFIEAVPEIKIPTRLAFNIGLILNPATFVNLQVSSLLTIIRELQSCVDKAEANFKSRQDSTNK